jgi:hypothetical protein
MILVLLLVGSNILTLPEAVPSAIAGRAAWLSAEARGGFNNIKEE